MPKNNPKAIPTYSNPTRKAWIVRILLVVCILFGLSRAVMGVTGMLFVEKVQAGVHVTVKEGTAIDNIDRLTAGSSTIMLWITGITFLFWNFNLRQNLIALGAKELRYNNVDAVGSFMVPFYNLYMPFKAMGETWKASSPEHMGPTEWKNAAAGGIVKVWWCMWILMHVSAAFLNACSVMVHRQNGSPPDLAQLHSVYVLILLYAIVYIVAAIVAIIGVTRLTARQVAKHEKFSQSVPISESQ